MNRAAIAGLLVVALVCSTRVVRAAETFVWEQRFDAAHPEPRVDHAVAFDSTRHLVVVFGGTRIASLPESQVVRGDTWELEGAMWIQRKPAHSPPARTGHAIAFDPGRGKVVLFGG